MDVHLNNMVNKAIQATEKQHREKIFSSGNSVLVPIWLVHNVDDKTLNDDNFLDNTTPYIEKGFEIPKKIVPEPFQPRLTIGFRVSEAPEPASISLLALGGLAMLRRRRSR